MCSVCLLHLWVVPEWESEKARTRSRTAQHRAAVVSNSWLFVACYCVLLIWQMQQRWWLYDYHVWSVVRYVNACSDARWTRLLWQVVVTAWRPTQHSCRQLDVQRRQPSGAISVDGFDAVSQATTHRGNELLQGATVSLLTVTYFGNRTVFVTETFLSPDLESGTICHGNYDTQISALDNSETCWNRIFLGFSQPQHIVIFDNCTLEALLLTYLLCISFHGKWILGPVLRDIGDCWNTAFVCSTALALVCDLFDLMPWWRRCSRRALAAQVAYDALPLMSILCSSGGFSERQLQSVAVLLDVVYPLLPWSTLRSTSGDVSMKEGVWVSLRLHTRNVSKIC